VDSDVVLKIGTWNVQYGRGAKKNATRLGLLLAEDADVWVLTETHSDLDLSPKYTSSTTTPRNSPNHGGRWTSIWTKWPIVERIETRDRSRTLAIHLEIAGCSVIVYGTVLPWLNDAGPSRDASGWTEFARVTSLQGEEWTRLRAEYPDAVVIVAGDLNQNLGGPHHYGTSNGRALLRNQLARADLVCLTDADRMIPGTLGRPPIDHVCVAVPTGSNLTSEIVTGWEGRQGDARLSDHSAVVAEMRLSQSTQG